MLHMVGSEEKITRYKAEVAQEAACKDVEKKYV